jgi:hypothetical protein
MQDARLDQADLGQIFVVLADGVSAQVMTRANFNNLSLEQFECWTEIGELDIMS